MTGHVPPAGTVRPAGQGDVDVHRAIAAAAYQPYVARIGRPPAPMTADYDQAVRSGQTWIAERDGQISGFVVLIAQPGYLLVENLAYYPRRGYAETHRADQDGFHRVFFRKPLP